MKFLFKEIVVLCKCKRRHPEPVLIAGLLISWLGLWACQAEQKSEIRIGVIAPLSSKAALSGKALLDAAKLAAQEINNLGGLDMGGYKRKVALLIEDNMDSPEVAVSVALKLINQEGVAALIGPNSSRSAIPVASVAENAHIPMISPGSTNAKTTAEKRYIFRASFVDAFQGKVMAHFAREELGARKAAVLYDVANAYNRGLAEIFKQTFEHEGGQVTAFESYTTGEKDFRLQLERVRESESEVLFLPNYTNEVLFQAKQARQMGIDATILGSDVWHAQTLATLSTLQGAFYSTHWAVTSANVKSHTFVEAYRKAYNRLPSNAAALTYDAFGLLFRAIQKQGQAQPESIRQGLSGIAGYNGVTGIFSYHGSGDPEKSAVILKIKKGKAVFYKLVNP